MSCCPKGSWSELQPDASYVNQGVVDKIGADLDVYRVGSGPKCIIWNYDIFGFNSGRTRQVADNLAKEGTIKEI